AGILTVDGDERQVTQVDPVLSVLILHLGLELARFPDHRLRPHMRDVVAAQSHVDLHARRHVVADDLDDVALGLEPCGRPVGDPDRDELTYPCTAGATWRDQHFLLDLRVVGLDKTDAGLLEVAPDDGFVGALDHLDNSAFATPAAVETGYAGEHAVAVEHQAHLRRTAEQVVTAVIRHHEAEAVTVTTDAATDQIELVHRRVGATAGIDELAVALHGAQAAPQRLELLICGQTELGHQLLASGGRTTLGQVMENQLAAGNGVFVFFRLAGGLRIEGLPIGH